MQNDGRRTPQSDYGSGMEEQRQELGGVPGQQDFRGHEGEKGSSMRGMASRAGEKLLDTAEQQKEAGAEYVTGVAAAVRRAASEFDEQIPQAAQYIRMAADQMEGMSESLRRRDMRQMLSDVQSFARRQPTAFLGVSLLAGFAAMRFLRSASPGRSAGSRDGEDVLDDGRYGAAGSSMPGGMSSGQGSSFPEPGM